MWTSSHCNYLKSNVGNRGFSKPNTQYAWMSGLLQQALLSHNSTISQFFNNQPILYQYKLPTLNKVRMQNYVLLCDAIIWTATWGVEGSQNTIIRMHWLRRSCLLWTLVSKSTITNNYYSKRGHTSFFFWYLVLHCAIKSWDILGHLIMLTLTTNCLFVKCHSYYCYWVLRKQ